MLSVAVFGAGFLVVCPLRSWTQTLFATNDARGVEFNRRVQAQRLDAVRPELRQNDSSRLEIKRGPSPTRGH